MNGLETTFWEFERNNIRSPALIVGLSEIHAKNMNKTELILEWIYHKEDIFKIISQNVTGSLLLKSVGESEIEENNIIKPAEKKENDDWILTNMDKGKKKKISGVFRSKSSIERYYGCFLKIMKSLKRLISSQEVLVIHAK